MTHPQGNFLDWTAKWMLQQEAAIALSGGDLVKQDIKACRKEAVFGAQWAKRRAKILAALLKEGMSEAEWTQKEAGSDITTMRRRVRLYREWSRYVAARRQAGDTGQTGLYYALSFVPDHQTDMATLRRLSPGYSPERSGTVSEIVAPELDLSRVRFISGEAFAELKKLQTKSVNVIMTSPPYYPAKREYGVAKCIGHESTLQEYIARLVKLFREARRVLKDDGILWIVIDDSYSRSSNTRQESDLPIASSDQDASGGRPHGNLLFIPTRLAMALQDDGWICRAEIVWDKGSHGRRESIKSRPRKNFEKVLMLTKQSQYFFDLDPLREPLSHPAMSPTRPRPISDGSSGLPYFSNPMGRVGGSVWYIPPFDYRGKHPATFPPQLVRRILAASCDNDAVVLDPLGGSGTVALVALQTGHRAITIDNNPAYTDEARQRIANARASVEVDNDDKGHGDESLAAD
jgi:DNA modification methylase